MDPGLNIVLLGNTGVGKSASGNTILQRKAFVSKRSFKSVTTRISEETEKVFGKQISVVDTPGILGAEDEVTDWCQKVLQSSRPCLFLVVIKIDRFTDEQSEAVKAAIRVLGPQGLKRSYLLFSCGDALATVSLKEFIFDEDEKSPLPDIVAKFAGKYHLFNNVDEDEEQVRDLLVKSGHLTCEQPTSRDPSVVPEERRIVLLGLPGVGKSSSGNTILGSDKFMAGSDFGPVTKKCDSASDIVGGRRVTVVDTPGFTDECLDPKQLFMALMEVIIKANPGPHAFVIVVKLGRITEADARMFEVLYKLFDMGATKHAMVLFTHGDDAGDQPLDERIQANPDMSKLIKRCGGRYCIFNNKARKSRQQVRRFLHTIEEVITANGGQHYTSEMFELAKTFINEERNHRLQRTGNHPSAQSPDPSAQSPDPPRQPGQSFWERLQCFFIKLWRKICDWFTQLCDWLASFNQTSRSQYTPLLV